jgi:hypothetical protein
MATKEISIKIPTSYADISLKNYIKLQKEIENYKEDDEAVTALMLYHLCGLDPIYLKSLSLQDYETIKVELNGFINNIELDLQKFITIDGVEYGFEPNLSNMSYGAYADITKYPQLQIDDNWANIMSILYRPVTHKKKDMYSIKTYSGELNPEIFLEVPMDIHFGALFFLLNLSTDLLKDILNSMTEMEAPPNIKSILARSGHLTQLLTNWPAAISLNSKK